MIKKSASIWLPAAMLLFFNYAFAAAPIITKFTPASGSPGTLVTVTGTNLSKTISLTIGGVNAIIISNTAKTLVGMVMPGASTGLVSISTPGGTAQSTKDFTVKSTPHPGAQQGNKLVATGGTGIQGQGTSVAISANGNTAIIGAPQYNNNAGGAWIFTRSGSSWTQGAFLSGNSASGASVYQGQSVSISADGKTAVLGGPGDAGGYGAIWVFVNSGGTWSQQGPKLVAHDTAGLSGLGNAVSMSANGHTVFVGGSNDSLGIGACWIFANNNGTWAQQGPKLLGTGAQQGYAGREPMQGWSVALSADGKTAIEGSYIENEYNGAIWVFTNNGGTWTQQGNKIEGVGTVGPSDFGWSVSLSADGNTALIGGINTYQDGGGVGACWVYTRKGTIWSQQGGLLIGKGYSGLPLQGNSVSLSADGNVAVESGYYDNVYAGAIWVFTRTGTTWKQQGNKLVDTGAAGNAYMGYSLALSADGNTAIAGGPYDNNQTGAAWVFVPGTIVLSPVLNESAYKNEDEAPEQTNNHPAFDVSVYPNPFAGGFHVKLTSGSTAVIDIKIYDMNGRMIEGRNAMPYNTDIILGNNYANGVYLVHVQQGNLIKELRVMKAE